MDFTTLPGVIPKNFKKGEVLIGQGEELTSLYYLTKGIVYRNVLTERGAETTLTIKSNQKKNDVGSLIGVLVLYNATPISLGSFIAKTDCQCLQIPVKSFLQQVRQEPLVLEQIIRYAMKNYADLLEMYRVRQDRDTVSKLCNIILNNAVERNGRILCINKLPNSDLADKLGVHPVTVSRIMSELQRKEIIRRNHGVIEILDKDYLYGIISHEEALSYRYKPQK